MFRPAAVRAGFPGLHPHDLRHTAASLAITAGADVLAVQRMLGHTYAATTLRIYGHLWDKQLDAVTTRMQEAREAAVDVERRQRILLVGEGG